MKTTFDLLDNLYPVINVSTVTTTLTGAVYRNSKPVNSILRDITVGALPIESSADIDLQQGVVVVNCFATDIAPGRPDDANLNTMASAVISVLEAYSSTTAYLDLTINSQGVMEDMDQAGMSYASIRVNCTIQYL